MSVFEKMEAANKDRDPGSYIDLMSEDFVFVRHQTGTTMNKKEMAQMIEAMFADGGFELNKWRRIYENDDILVAHSVNDYPDGTREAVLEAYTLKDGKITRLETGATPLPR